MVDLGELEKRINEVADLRARFVADPAAVLRAEGLTISPQMLDLLKAHITAQVGDEAGVVGSLQSSRARGRAPRPFGLHPG